MSAFRTHRSPQSLFTSFNLLVNEHPGLRFFAAAPNHMALIKQLREQTGAPIADVKSALQQVDWNLEKAAQELRKKGLAAAGKKASRHAAEGLVGLATSPTSAAIIEINSETDFVARNDQFKQLVSQAAQALLQANPNTINDVNGEVDVTTAGDVKFGSDSTLGSAVADVAGVVRENIKLRRGFYFSTRRDGDTQAGTIGTYVHGSVGPGLGRIAAVVKLQWDADSLQQHTAIRDVAHKLAMHVVGAVPRYLSKEYVPPAALESEKAVLSEQAAASGKPPAIVEKMVLGRLSKYYEEVCLLEQPYIMDDKKKIKDVVSDVAQQAGVANLVVCGFARVQVGEGLEVGEDKDFAAEVAETLNAAVSK